MSFHELLKNLRKSKHISQKSLCAGLCSVATLSRIERGEIETTKMLRDRLLGRVGLSLDGFEEYLSSAEYEVWKRRKAALKAYEADDTAGLRIAIEDYKDVIDEDQPIAMQLALVLEAHVLKTEKQPRSRLNNLYKKAILLTMPSEDVSVLKECALSVPEISIVLDYIDTRSKRNREENTVAILAEMIQYIESAELEEILFAKIYTKAVYLYLKHKSDEKVNHTEIPELIQLCEKAIDLLRNTGRSYYVVELLGFYAELLFREMKERPGSLNQLQEQYKNAGETKQTLLRIYERYHLDARMKNDAYLYDETEIYLIGDAIRRRRIMMGLSRRELAEQSGCSEKTIYRAEKGKDSVQGYVFKCIFRALGLPTEYIMRELITSRAEVFGLMILKKKANEESRVAEERSIINKIESMIDGSIIQNKQYLTCWNTALDCRQGIISKADYYNGIRKTIGMTIPDGIRHDHKEYYLTKTEVLCFHLLVILNMERAEDDENIRLLWTYFQRMKEKGEESVFIQLYELVMTTFASLYGNRGEHIESDRISHGIIEMCLQKRRLIHVFTNIYNLVWNRMQANESVKQQDKDRILEGLQECICLSRFCKRFANESFFKKEMESLRP